MSEVKEYNGIRFEKNKILNLQDNIPFKVIERDKIKSLIFKFGFLSKLPLIHFLLGISFVIFGLFAVRFTFIWLTEGGLAYDFQLIFILALPFGLWVIYDGLKKGYYLEIIYDSKKEKMFFNKKISTEELYPIINEVEQLFNYRIILNKK